MENYTSGKKDSTSLFMIQPGYVEGIVVESLQFNSVEIAFENLFRNNKEFCMIVWNKIPFRLSYHDDIPFLIRSITRLLNATVNHDEEKWEVRCNSKNCEFIWSFSKVKDDLIITGNFTKITGSYEKAINSLCSLQIDIDIFLSEWKLLIEQILTAFEESEYQLNHYDDQKIIDDLTQINDLIPDRALRYQYDKR